MELRKIVVYAIFAAVSIYGIYFHFFSGETTTKVPEAVRTEAPIQATISAPAENDCVERKPADKREDTLENQNGPRRNPFRKSESSTQ